MGPPEPARPGRQKILGGMGSGQVLIASGVVTGGFSAEGSGALAWVLGII